MQRGQGDKEVAVLGRRKQQKTVAKAPPARVEEGVQGKMRTDKACLRQQDTAQGLRSHAVGLLRFAIQNSRDASALPDRAHTLAV